MGFVIGPLPWEQPRLKYSQNPKGNENRADVVESQDGVTRTSVYQLHVKQSGDKHIVHSTDLILLVSHIRDVVVSDKVIGQQQRDLSQTLQVTCEEPHLHILWRMLCAGFRHAAGFHARVILDSAACRLGVLGEADDVQGILG